MFFEVLRVTYHSPITIAFPLSRWQVPGLALPEIQTLSQYLNSLIAQPRFNMLLLSLFGLLGIVIACVGFYGVVATS